MMSDADVNPRAIPGDNTNAIDYGKEEAERLQRDYPWIDPTIAELKAERAALPPITSDETMAPWAKLEKRIRDLAKRLAKIHDAEKEPHLRRGQAVDKKFFGAEEQLVKPKKTAANGMADDVADVIDTYMQEKLRIERLAREEAERKAKAAEDALRREREENERKERERVDQERREREAREEEHRKKRAAEEAARVERDRIAQEAEAKAARARNEETRKKAAEEAAKLRAANEATRKAEEEAARLQRQENERKQREEDDRRRELEETNRRNRVREEEAAAATREATAAANAKAADLVGTRVGDDIKVTMQRTYYADVVDVNLLDKDELWVFVSDKAKAAALTDWAKKTGHSKKMAGARIGFTEKSKTN